MGITERIVRGAVAGGVGTVALTALRKGLAAADLIGVTAPEQVVARAEELGLIGDPGPKARRVLELAAHFGYGVSVGAVFGVLRPEDAEVKDEVAVGTALGILSWGAGWAGWLPLAGVHGAPWQQRTPKVLLPVLDHAVFGAVWGLVYGLLRRSS
jgi:hypothetical protein